LKKFEEAERCWKKLLVLDKDFRQAYLNLLELYATTGNDGEYITLLKKVTLWPDAPVIVYKKLGDYYLKNNDIENARTAYKTALEKGLDGRIRKCLNKQFILYHKQ